MAFVDIEQPKPYCCLPTLNAVVSGTYEANFKTLPKAEELTGVLYFVRVTVGGDPSGDSPSYPDLSRPWSVPFAVLTEANNVTVTAQLMKTVNSAPAVAIGNPDQVFHVNVTEVCVVPTDDGGPIVRTAMLAAAKLATPTARPRPARTQHHMTIRWQYGTAYELELLRAVALVMRIETVSGMPQPAEVWSVVDATAHDGWATAVIPVPQFEHCVDAEYQYYFLLLSRTSSQYLARSVPIDLQPE